MQCHPKVVLILSISTYIQCNIIQRNTSCFNNDVKNYNKTLVVNYSLQNYTWVEINFPRCWDNILTLWCYERSGDELCRDLCLQMKESCSMLKDDLKWMNEIDCMEKNETCAKNVSASTKNTCGGDLESISDPNSWLIDWEELNSMGTNSSFGCALHCDSPLHYHEMRKKEITVSIVTLGVVAILACLFTIASFVVDWKNQQRYPAVILLILNICYFLCFVGWILQFMGAGKKISCGKNGVKRIQEPRSANDSVLCMLSFVLIYYSMLAIALWYTVLMYAWSISFKALSTTQDVISGKVRYFHFIVWFTAILVTSLVLSFQQVDGHEITNICFVSSVDGTAMKWFVIAPLITCLILGEFFLASCIRHLYRLRATCVSLIIPKASDNISRTIYRLLIYGVIILITTSLPIICLVHQDQNKQKTSLAYSEYIMCKLKGLPKDDSCELKNDHRFIYFHIQYSSLVISSLACSSWTWTSATLKIWYQTWRKYRTRRERRSKLNVSWYLRMQKKQISPYVPPIDPQDPLNTKFPPNDAELILGRRSKRSSENSLIVSFSQRLPHRKSVNNRRHSDDIRSVVDLFAGRRGTKASIHSMLSEQPIKGFKRSKSLSSLQSFGHLTARDIKPPFRRPSSNLTVIHLDENQKEQRRRSSNKTLKHARDAVYTSLSHVHRNNIVADCIPYNSRPNTSQ